VSRELHATRPSDPLHPIPTEIQERVLATERRLDARAAARRTRKTEHGVPLEATSEVLPRLHSEDFLPVIHPPAHLPPSPPAVILADLAAASEGAPAGRNPPTRTKPKSKPKLHPPTGGARRRLDVRPPSNLSHPKASASRRPQRVTASGGAAPPSAPPTPLLMLVFPRTWRPSCGLPAFLTQLLPDPHRRPRPRPHPGLGNPPVHHRR
jgi:hypothetical protein